MCSNYKCLDDKYNYYKINRNCPRDSHLVDTNMIEKQCCLVEKACECNDCPLKSEMVQFQMNFDITIIFKIKIKYFISNKD